MLDHPHHAGMNAPKISAAAQALFPAEVAVAVLDPRLAQGNLIGDEPQIIARAKPGRVREFTAGRVAARLAMLAMGAPARPVLSRDNRAPIWPAGIVGSISHAPACCISVIAAARNIASLGVDVEPWEPLPVDLHRTICTKGELDWLNCQHPAQRDYFAKLIFSAKECAYKSQFPLSGQILNYDAIKISLNLNRVRFSARFTQSIPPFQVGDRLSGRFAITEGLILTGMAIGA